MDRKSFAEMIYLLAENFNFEVSDMWLEMIYDVTNRFTDEEIIYARNKIVSVTQEEWNKKYGYGGKPAIADWVNFFNSKKIDDKKRLEHEKLEKAIQKVERARQLAIKYHVNPSDLDKGQRLLT